MIRLHQIPLGLDAARDEQALLRAAAQRLGISAGALQSAALSRLSVDARDKGSVRFAATLDVRAQNAKDEKRLIARFKPNEAAVVSGESAPDAFHLPVQPYEGLRPLVVGAGPAGLFCALGLALRGAKPLLIDRGQPVERRAQDVERLESTGALDPESNVLFGEGGAGAFSDGKLTCGLNSPKIATVLQTFAACGAPGEIVYAAKPHIGTDELRGVLKTLRARLLELGAEIRFGCKLTGLDIQNGAVCAAMLNGERFETSAVYLAIGHSARDTYALLHGLGVPMERKPFAVGVRVEHRQEVIDRAQYGRFAGHPALPPADYKLNVPTPDGRGAYTFCMCPGGRVINASSEPGLLNVNGMSLHARDGENANAALLVGVAPNDYPGEGPLAGVEWQRSLERAAFAAGGGGCIAPCQRVADFLAGRPTTAFGGVRPSYRPGVAPGRVDACLPDFVADNLRFALPRLGQRLRGFDDGDALLTGVEARSSAPLRILRGPDRQSAVRGLYPLGEGAGYAGGIMSAAVDGLSAALNESKEDKAP